MSGENLPGFETPLRCGRIIPAHVGGRPSEKALWYWVSLEMT